MCLRKWLRDPYVLNVFLDGAIEDTKVSWYLKLQYGSSKCHQGTVYPKFKNSSTKIEDMCLREWLRDNYVLNVFLDGAVKDTKGFWFFKLQLGSSEGDQGTVYPKFQNSSTKIEDICLRDPYALNVFLDGAVEDTKGSWFLKHQLLLSEGDRRTVYLKFQSSSTKIEDICLRDPCVLNVFLDGDVEDPRGSWFLNLHLGSHMGGQRTVYPEFQKSSTEFEDICLRELVT